jgi:hypothetical protein
MYLSKINASKRYIFNYKCINNDKYTFWATLGRFFHKLNGSPCSTGPAPDVTSAKKYLLAMQSFFICMHACTHAVIRSLQNQAQTEKETLAENGSKTGLPDFSCQNVPKWEIYTKIYQYNLKYDHMAFYLQNGCKILCKK